MDTTTSPASRVVEPRPPRGQEALLISPRKVLRDLIILVPLLIGIGYGIRELGWLDPAPPPGMGQSAGAGQGAAQAPEGTDPEVLAVLAHLDRNSETLIATIGDMEITRGDLDRRASTLITRMNQPLAQNLKPEIQAEFLRVQVFYDVSREIAEDQAAIRYGMTPDEADVEAHVARIESGFESKEAFAEQLAAMQTDRDGMLSLARKQLASAMLRDKVLTDLGVDPEGAEADRRYEEWLGQQVTVMDVKVVDASFRDSMQKLVELFQQAPDHGQGHASGSGGGHGAHPPGEHVH